MCSGAPHGLANANVDVAPAQIPEALERAAPPGRRASAVDAATARPSAARGATTHAREILSFPRLCAYNLWMNYVDVFIASRKVPLRADVAVGAGRAAGAKGAHRHTTSGPAGGGRTRRAGRCAAVPAAPVSKNPREGEICLRRLLQTSGVQRPHTYDIYPLSSGQAPARPPPDLARHRVLDASKKHVQSQKTISTRYLKKKN